MAPESTIVLTGANGGLGTAIVSKILSSRELATSCHGIYAVREVSTATILQQTLKDAPSVLHANNVVSLDLSRLVSVRQAAGEINRRVAASEVPPIRALVLCAGWQEWSTQSYSQDGFEMNFQANYLGHWLLTLLLLQSMDREKGRIIFLSSSTQDPSDKLNNLAGDAFKDPKWKTLFHDTDSLAKGTWSSSLDDNSQNAGFRRYGAAKLCLVMMMYELQKRLDSDPALSNISVMGIDPGAMPTTLQRHMTWFQRTVRVAMILLVLGIIMTWFTPTSPLRTVSQSAKDVVQASLGDKPSGKPKAKYLNGSVEKEPNPEAKNEGKREMLWRDSIRYTGLQGDDTVLKAWR